MNAFHKQVNKHAIPVLLSKLFFSSSSLDIKDRSLKCVSIITSQSCAYSSMSYICSQSVHQGYCTGIPIMVSVSVLIYALKTNIVH